MTGPNAAEHGFEACMHDCATAAAIELTANSISAGDKESLLMSQLVAFKAKHFSLKRTIFTVFLTVFCFCSFWKYS